MQWNLLLLATWACRTTPPVAPVNDVTTPTSEEGSLEDLSGLLEPIHAEYGLVALAAVELDGSGLLGAGATGLRKVDGEPVETDDRWHLGSDTKAMTATLVARLVESETVRWDLKITDVFPDADPGWAGVDLEALLQHRGGAPASLGASHPDIWSGLWQRNQDGKADRAWFAGELLAEAPTETVGTYVYSNGGYMLAGAMLEAVTDGDWQDLLQGEVFGPLAMDSCGFGAPKGENPQGHSLSPDGQLVAVDPNSPSSDNPVGLGPAGTVNCSLASWANFVQANLSRDDYLSADSWDMLHTPVDDYAMGWIVAERSWARGAALTHAGSNTMWFANAWVAPGVDRAWLVVTNSAHEQAALGTDAAVSALIERL